MPKCILMPGINFETRNNEIENDSGFENKNPIAFSMFFYIRSKKEGNLRYKAHRAWRIAKTNIAMPAAPCAMLKNQHI